MFKRFSVGFAVGYVMGARAGEKRYDQITGMAEKAMAIPGVDRVTEQASGFLTADNGRRILGSVVERARSGVLNSHHDTSSSDEDEDDEDEEGWDVQQDDYEDDERPDDEESRDSEDSAADEDSAGDGDEGGEDEADEDDDGVSVVRHRNGSKPSRPSRRPERARRTAERPRRHGGRIRGLASAAIERGRVD